MRYLCQVIIPEGAIEAMSPEEKEKLDRDSLAYDRVLEAEGAMVRAEALESPKTAITVRVRKGETLTTDGPFTEAKEYLGGFILVTARDMNEAIRIAAGIPLAKYGSIEVRPVMMFGDE